MKSKLQLFTFILILVISSAFAQNSAEKLTFFKANNPNFQCTGRIDFSNPELPRFWNPGVYIQAKFKGTSCEIKINDEVLWGKNHNYISVVIDNGLPQRIKLTEKENTLKVAENLKGKTHTLLICKSTEAGIGYIEFVGIKVEKLLKPTVQPTRRIEFIGNSISCGTGSDETVFPCEKGEWYDQHNAYLSYGPSTARLLNAQWILTAVSGIGLVHSCCNMDRIMPDVIDKVNLDQKKSQNWDFTKYQPDVLTIALGQNDGIQDSSFFCDSYIAFIKRLRSYYPNTTFICLTSPMADANLLIFMKKSLTAITSAINKTGDTNVYNYFFTKRFNNGCGDHPNLVEHAEIAKELSNYIKGIKKW